MLLRGGAHASYVGADGLTAAAAAYDRLQTWSKPTDEVMQGVIATLDVLFNSGATPNARTERDTPLLLHAVVKEREPIVGLLLAHSARPDLTTANGLAYYAGMTPLAVAAENGNMFSLRALLAAGADPNALTARFQYSPILLAVRKDNAPAARWLLEAGADPNLSSESGYTPLMSAARWPSPEDVQQVRLLLSYGADPNARDDQGSTALMEVATSKDCDAFNSCTIIAETLLAAGADPNTRDDEGSTALDRAIRFGHDDMAALLRSVTHDLSEQHASDKALTTAAAEGDLASLQRRLAAGADPNTRQDMVLHEGAFVVPDAPALLFAIYHDHPLSASALLESGADPNAAAGNGLVAILSSWKGDALMAERLIEAGADASLRADDGWGALTGAAGGNPRLARRLLRAGADPNAATVEGGHTGLHRAAVEDYGLVATILLEAGADPHHRDAKEQTPLHLAIRRHSLLAAEVLLDAGAHPFAADAEGHTPLSIAQELGDEDAEALLRRYGTDNPEDILSQTNGAALEESFQGDTHEPQAFSPDGLERRSGDVEVFQPFSIEEKPELIGGMAALMSRLQYPESARREGIEGTAFVNFIVTPDGYAIHASCARAPDVTTCQAAIAALNTVRFTPGQYRGKPVYVELSLSVIFRLD